MLAKVICVHLVNDLGYDLLFQDVDVSWYRNPFDYFQAAENDGFDMYFQGMFISICDCNRSLWYKYLMRMNLSSSSKTTEADK